MPFCSLKIIYKSNLIVIATSMGRNAVVVTRVSCILQTRVSITDIAVFIRLESYTH